MIDLKQFASALNQISEEKGISSGKVLTTIEMALAAAYKKEYGEKGQIVRAKFNPNTGSVKFFQIKTVGDEMEFALEAHEDFGRIAAQTAKQVIIQRIREAEREAVWEEYKDKEGE